MDIFIDFCVFIVLAVVPYITMLLSCKYGTKGQDIRCTVGALMISLAVSCIINGLLICCILIKYGFLPEIF